MRILIAPNSMKGSIDAFQFADIVAEAFQSVSNDFEIRKLPVADGGDYTGPVLSRALNGISVSVETEDPLGRKLNATYFRAGKTAIIEMASASGFTLLTTKEANPWITTSRGTGIMIQHAWQNGCREILLGVGGSATVDGGIGLLGALGFVFYDHKGFTLSATPESMHRIERIVIPASLSDFPKIRILCDVNNPLLGDNGAAKIFGPQKGADPNCVERLELGLTHWISVLETFGKRSLSPMDGMGAAGGIASGLVAFLGGEMVMGGPYILDALQIDDHLLWSQLVITGEGKADAQSLSLKAPIAVAMRAQKLGRPVIALTGAHDSSVKYPFDAIFSLSTGPTSLEQSIADAPQLLYSLAVQIAKLLNYSKQICREPNKC